MFAQKQLLLLRLLDVFSSNEMQKFLGMDVFIEETRKQKFSKEISDSDDFKRI